MSSVLQNILPKQTHHVKRVLQAFAWSENGKSRSLLKMISRKAAGTVDAEAYCRVYVEVDRRLRTQRERIFSSRLEVADGALEDGNLRDRIARRFQFGANLILEVGRIPDSIDEQIEESLGRQQTLSL